MRFFFSLFLFFPTFSPFFPSSSPSHFFSGKVEVEQTQMSANLLAPQQVLGPMPALAESTPEDDRIADTSNVASLYKVSARSRHLILSRGLLSFSMSSFLLI